MKIAICGKGGGGKSTITALLGKEFARQGKEVLIIDSDESNYGLHRQLGMELPRNFTEYFGGKDKAFKTMMTSGILEQMKLSAFAKKFFLRNGRSRIFRKSMLKRKTALCSCQAVRYAGRMKDAPVP